MLNHVLIKCTIMKALIYQIPWTLSETGLKPEIPNSILELPGFDIIRWDRRLATKTCGGWAALYVNTALNISHSKQPQTKLHELCDSVWAKSNR